MYKNLGIVKLANKKAIGIKTDSSLEEFSKEYKLGDRFNGFIIVGVSVLPYSESLFNKLKED